MKPIARACSCVLLWTSLTSLLSAGNGPKLVAQISGTPPLTFEQRGSVAEPFVAHVAGRQLAFGVSGMVTETSANGTPQPVLRFVGARRNSQPQPEGPPAGIANYLLGADPGEWR